MLEIMFSDSAGGSFRMAQYYGKGEYQADNASVFVSFSDEGAVDEKEIEKARRELEEEERMEWEQSVPLGGNPSDIFSFHLVLSAGDISEDVPGVRRRQVLEQVYAIYPMGGQAAAELSKRVSNHLKTIKKRMEEGESLRIWYSNHPDEMCGLYWFMDQLSQWGTYFRQITLVKLPEWEVLEDGQVVERAQWGETKPSEWRRYISMEKPVSKALCHQFASCWKQLKQENAPLRAVINGRLTSVSQAFYDDCIRNEIPDTDEPFQEARLIGTILLKYRSGFSDAWAAQRIEKIIDDGILEAVSTAPDDSPSYHRLLRKREESKTL